VFESLLRLRLLPRFALLPIFFFSATLSASEDSNYLLILQPGYPGSTKDAVGFVSQLCKAVTKLGGVSIGGGEYHNREKRGLETVELKKPAVGIFSLGMYLKHKKPLGLQALLVSDPERPYYVVARKGAFRDLQALKGKKVTGTPLTEPEFFERVLFSSGGAAGASPVSGWQTRAARSCTKGLRDLRRQRTDAVVLNGREYVGFLGKKKLDGLEAFHETRNFPLAVVVTIGRGLSDEEETQLVKAFEALGQSAGGKSLLAEMGIEKFTRTESEKFREYEVLYREKDPSKAKDGAKTESRE